MIQEQHIQRDLDSLQFCAAPVKHLLLLCHFLSDSLFPWITDMKLSSSLKEMKPIIKLPYLSICVVFA